MPVPWYYDPFFFSGSISGGEAVPHELSYTVASPSPEPVANPDGGDWVLARTEARDFRWTPTVVPVDPTAEEEWEVVISGFGLAADLVYDLNDLQVDVDEWTILCPIALGEFDDFANGSWGLVDLWYKPGGNDRQLQSRHRFLCVKNA